MEYQYTKESLEHNFQRVLDGLMELIFLFDGRRYFSFQ